MDHIKIIKDAFDIYSRHYKSLGDYSATGLINPVRVVALGKRYGHLAKRSLKGQAASLIGTAVHEMMERLLRQANVINPDYLLERGLVHPFWIGDNDFRLVSGRFDILHDEKDIYDIKTTKCWHLVFDPDMVDWHQQQNIYAFLLKMRGVTVETLNIVAFYLDWIESKTLRDKKYPQSPVVEYQLELWTPQEQEDFIMHRLQMHVEAESTPDEELPVCTQEERWEEPPVFAIMKGPNAKRAAKLIKNGTFEDALKAARGMGGLGNESFIEIRYENRKRCLKYCDVNEYCNVYQDYIKEVNNGKQNEIIPLASVL